MSKEKLLAPPEVQLLPTGEYSLTVGDSEDGHGEQIFKALTLELLCSRLGTAAQHATAHIRTLSRENEQLRADYAITRDICSLLTALVLVRHASHDEPTKMLDKVIRSMAKDLSDRLPEAPTPSEK